MISDSRWLNVIRFFIIFCFIKFDALISFLLSTETNILNEWMQYNNPTGHSRYLFLHQVVVAWSNNVRRSTFDTHNQIIIICTLHTFHWRKTTFIENNELWWKWKDGLHSMLLWNRKTQLHVRSSTSKYACQSHNLSFNEWISKHINFDFAIFNTFKIYHFSIEHWTSII